MGDFSESRESWRVSSGQVEACCSCGLLFCRGIVADVSVDLGGDPGEQTRTVDGDGSCTRYQSEVGSVGSYLTLKWGEDFDELASDKRIKGTWRRICYLLCRIRHSDGSVERGVLPEHTRTARGTRLSQGQFSIRIYLHSIPAAHCVASTDAVYQSKASIPTVVSGFPAPALRSANPRGAETWHGQ